MSEKMLLGLPVRYSKMVSKIFGRSFFGPVENVRPSQVYFTFLYPLKTSENDKK